MAALSVDVPARYTLEICQGTVVGDYGATLTPGGILDYQTSGYFGLSGWREHPIFLAPRLPPIDDFPGTLLNLTTRGTSSNYYHFLFDALPRFGICEESMPGTAVDAILVPHRAGYQRELLELAGIRSPLLQPGRRTAIRARRLLVPSTPNQDLAAPRWVTEWLRKRLPPSEAVTAGRRLYLSRGARPNTRRYVQEAELWPSLARRGFQVVDPGTLSVQAQIDLFHSAEIIVAPHGAALTNLLFCRPGVRVLELFAGEYVHLGLWAISQSIEGVTYQYLVGEGAADPGKPMTGVLTDIRIDPGKVLDSVDALL